LKQSIFIEHWIWSSVQKTVPISRVSDASVERFYSFSQNTSYD